MCFDQEDCKKLSLSQCPKEMRVVQSDIKGTRSTSIEELNCQTTFRKRMHNVVPFQGEFFHVSPELVFCTINGEEKGSFADFVFCEETEVEITTENVDELPVNSEWENTNEDEKDIFGFFCETCLRKSYNKHSTFRDFDPLRIPRYYRTIISSLNNVEKLALSRMITYRVREKHVYTGSTRMKSHVFCVPMDTSKSITTESLNVHAAKDVQILLLGTGVGHTALKHQFNTLGELRVDPPKMISLLKYFQLMQHPQYQTNIDEERIENDAKYIESHIQSNLHVGEGHIIKYVERRMERKKGKSSSIVLPAEGSISNRQGFEAVRKKFETFNLSTNNDAEILDSTKMDENENDVTENLGEPDDSTKIDDNENEDSTKIDENENDVAHNIDDDEIEDSTKIDDEHRIELEIQVSNDLMNEFTQNHIILGSAFPFLFPGGLSERFKCGALPTKITNRLLRYVTFAIRYNMMHQHTHFCTYIHRYYDTRFANDHDFIGVIGSQKFRHKVCGDLAGKSGKRARELMIELMDDPDLLQKLKDAKESPNAYSSVRLARKLHNVFRIAGRNIEWSSTHRSAELPRLLAYQDRYGSMFDFTTLSPWGPNDPRVIKYAKRTIHSTESIKSLWNRLGVKGRSRVEAESPDSCVSQFEIKLLNIFESFQGVQMKPGYTTEGSSNPFRKIGLSGHTIAGFIIIEDQSRGALHAHTTIFVLYGPH